ncbi:arginine--tRNA ligase [Streptomyces sp. NBC_00006]|uniref:arginine--tRNA ligase n=1 Tax=Streptomyces sp. NBC_00006 TaxID=2975619 RepID=UPI002259396D|nr:arginine--tRNA ligase [Streptomyces sp. NBC_00006]MCX5532020.1 arginine--tRNA ligase [Streptomyces sp. NBC_00006]
MAPVPSITASVNARLADALTSALPEAGGADPLLRRSDRADYQANGILALAKKAKANPRELATQVVEKITNGELIAEVEVSGPGFLNVTVTDKAITETLAARAADTDRLGVPTKAEPGVTVIDYAQPNVAKEMHVGHLRSAVIGDALRGMLDFTGERTIGRHHIGDWGTQFGMLIQYVIEHPEELPKAGADADGEQAMSTLNRIYKASRAVFDADEDFKERARKRVVALQSGDKETLDLWQRFVDESKVYFYSVFEKLDMEIRDDEIVGESAYNDGMPETARLLEESGVAVRSEGALVVFFDDIKGKDDQPVPLIVQKADGGFGYAASDLTAIRNRVQDLDATSLLYVVDVRQSLHFKMVFETARRAGWLSDEVSAHNMAYGTVLGADGKPFKTRAGETVRLEDLLDEAVQRAAEVVREKARDLSEDEIQERAAQVGIGAVKYADLSTSPSRDYKFDLDQMVSLNGDTSVYLQYAYARIQSILRKAGEAKPAAHAELELAPAERALGLHLDAFGDTVFEAAAEYAPHKLAAYLYQLASLYTTFYDKCPVLKADSTEQVENRLFLCDLTARTLHRGMALLGIRTPEKL